MKTYIKNGIVKKKNTIVIHKDGSQIINPPHDLLIECGWEEYTTPEISPEQKIQSAKLTKCNEILMYDSSSEVNEFYIQDMPVWLDKDMRTGLMLRFNSEFAMKKENTTLWYNGVSFTLPLSSAIQMLYALEVYASECYDNTQVHLANVEKLETLEEIQEYDYSVGYPEKLRF